MALIFSARSVGYLLGALIGGFLFDILDKQLLLTATLFVAAVATLIIPWSVTLMVLAVMFSLQGVAMGVLDTGNLLSNRTNINVCLVYDPGGLSVVMFVLSMIKEV